VVVGLSPLVYISNETAMIFNIFTAICISLMLFLSTYANYRMSVIAKSKRASRKIVPIAQTSNNRCGKKRIINLKDISTCSLAVGCYLVCFSPFIVYVASEYFERGVPTYNKKRFLFDLWTNTFFSINSTLNCVIFFWRNSILRRVGMKIINALKKL
jgi:hypothetical protein